MNSKKQFLRIIWAIDPSDLAMSFSTSVPQVLRYFQRTPATVIEPVHVLKLAPEISGDFTAKWVPEYSAAAEDHLQQITREFKVRDTAPPKVIFHDSMSTKGAVDALADYAVRSRADLIIAQSHSRKGVGRLFLGSFAETLLFRSKVPVMLIGKEMRSFGGFKNILFPTDFGPTARAQLNRVLDLARAMKSQVTLFHSIPHPIEPVWSTFYQPSSLGPFAEYVKSQVELTTKNAEEWKSVAESRGIHFDYVIDEKGLDVWGQIISLAKKKNAGLIAMEAQNGPVAATLLGSVTRQVVRHAPCPVLVLKTKAARTVALPKAA